MNRQPTPSLSARQALAPHRAFTGIAELTLIRFRTIREALVFSSVAAGGFVWYLQPVPDCSATYAGVAGIMTTLIFLYLMAVILLFGAEYNSAVEHPGSVNLCDS